MLIDRAAEVKALQAMYWGTWRVNFVSNSFAKSANDRLKIGTVSR